jgi:hypothetical protein
MEGESREISSLIPEDEPRGRKGGGGGVRPLSSVNVSQKSLPFEFRMACCLKLLESPDDISAIMSSSGMPSNESCVVGPMFGEECVVDNEACRVGSRSMSLSRVCRTTSASCRTSVSTGVLSSARAARIRAKPFVLGYTILALYIIKFCRAAYQHIAPPGHCSTNDPPLPIPTWRDWQTVCVF